jgi:hypothetical protein
MISVYRIYLGRSWVTSGQVAPLLSQFDDLPEFLHAVASLPETGPEIETRDPAFRRAAVKVAMTQCHAAIVWGSTDDPAPEWTEHEMRVAKWGFRRRIPLLAVSCYAPRRRRDRRVQWPRDRASRSGVGRGGDRGAP